MIGYYDRLEGRVLEIPLSRVHFDPENHFSFRATLRDGSQHDVPFHRVRRVYRDGVLIWKRPG